MSANTELSQGITAPTRMPHRPSIETWKRLYKCIDTAPHRYPVETWLVEPRKNHELFNGIDVWPILKSGLLLRAANYFHTETGARVLIDEATRKTPSNDLRHSDKLNTTVVDARARRLKLSTFKAKLNSIGIGRAAKSWPKTHSEVLMIGANINAYEVGGMLVQNHLDPVRLAFEDVGMRTATFLTDVPADHPDLDKCLLGGTYGFKHAFDAARTTYDNTRMIDFSEFEGFTDLLDEIEDIFDISSITTRQILSNLVRQTISTYQIFRDYLKLGNYKAVGIYCYYGIAGFALSLACRENNIPLIDIQHGVSGEGHESYSYPNAPKGGYNSIPTHFFCWTKQEADFIRKHLPDYANRVTSVGHSWKLTEEVLLSDNHLLPLVNRDRHIQFLQGFDTQIAEAKVVFEKRDGIKNVLVASYTNEPLDWLAGFINATAGKVNVFVRLHPGEAKNSAALEKRKAQFADLNVKFLEATKLAIPIVLSHMDVVINRYSSIVRDAAAYGVPSLCYSESAAWYHNPLVFEGVKVVDFTTEAIVEGTLDLLFKNVPTLTPQKYSSFEELKAHCRRITSQHIDDV